MENKCHKRLNPKNEKEKEKIVSREMSKSGQGCIEEAGGLRLFFPFRIWEYYFFFLCREHHNTANKEDRQDSEQSFSFWEKKKKKTFSLAEIAYKKVAVRNEGESVKIVERERERGSTARQSRCHSRYIRLWVWRRHARDKEIMSQKRKGKKEWFRYKRSSPSISQGQGKKRQSMRQLQAGNKMKQMETDEGERSKAAFFCCDCVPSV